MSFFMVPPAQIDAVWLKAREILLPSFRFRIYTHTVDDYPVMLKAGTMQLWLAEINSVLKGAVITTIEKGTAATICSVLSLAGEDFKEWSREFEEAITAFAKMHSCDAIEAITRPGFSKVLSECIPDGIIHVKLLGKNNE